MFTSIGKQESIEDDRLFEISAGTIHRKEWSSTNRREDLFHHATLDNRTMTIVVSDFSIDRYSSMLWWLAGRIAMKSKVKVVDGMTVRRSPTIAADRLLKEKGR